MQNTLWHDTGNWSSLIWSKSTDVIEGDMHFIIVLWDFLWEDPGEAKYQVWWLWLTLMSNKLITRRKTCYESEAEPGGSLSLVPTIRSNHSMPEELEKPVGKERVIVPCLIKVSALCLSDCRSLTKLYYCSRQWFSPWKGSLCQCCDGDYGPHSDLPFWTSHVACKRF